MGNWHYFEHVALIFQVLDDCLPSFKPVHAFVLAGIFVHCGVFIHRIQLWQVVALTNLEVVRVVGWGNLNHPRSEVWGNVFVGNDFDFPVNQWYFDLLADQFLVAFVVRMDSDRFVTEHRFRTGRRNFDVVLAVKGRAVGKRVFNVVEGTLIILVDNFNVRQGRPRLRIPVNNVGSPVNQALLVEVNEDLPHGLVQSFIQGKAFPVVINGNPHLGPLLMDNVGVLVLPVPDLLNELFPAQIVTGNPLLAQPGFYLRLGGNSGVVHSRNPQNVVTLHPLLTDNNILQGRVPGVAQVKFPGNVRRRDHDRIRVGLLVTAGFEQALVNPPLVAASFNC